MDLSQTSITQLLFHQDITYANLLNWTVWLSLSLSCERESARNLTSVDACLYLRNYLLFIILPANTNTRLSPDLPNSSPPSWNRFYWQFSRNEILFELRFKNTLPPRLAHLVWLQPGPEPRHTVVLSVSSRQQKTDPKSSEPMEERTVPCGLSV